MYTQLRETIKTLSQLSEREIRKLRREDKDFDKFMGELYKFLCVDKIKSKASGQRLKQRAPRVPSQYPKCYMCHHRILAASEHSSLCTTCCDTNRYYKTTQLDMSGKYVIVTGGRVKVGYYTALRFLRLGAEVIVTTRFPLDAAERYSKEPDYTGWKGRLHIRGADFRSLQQLTDFVGYVKGLGVPIYALINNAAQTVRRPAQYYAHLTDVRQSALEGMKGETLSRYLARIQSSLDICRAEDFPQDKYDIDGQQLDLRTHNSWTQKIDDVNIEECVETQLINSTAPFYLIQSLDIRDGFIINVTSAEGRMDKELPQHPHNNMSKAALNMLTRTIGADYYKTRNTVVVGIDTGWANVMVGPTQMASLDYCDSAARVLQPFVDAHIGRDMKPYCGACLRNFVIVPW